MARRRMQNAADAGALAGARAICFGDSSVGGINAAAQEYAVTRNGATVADVDIGYGTVGSYTTPVTVTVVTTETLSTYFLQLIPGLQTMNVPARAVAVCGKFIKMSGFWPMVADADTWFDKGCGKSFWVSLSSCTDSPSDPNCIDCSVLECDIDGDGQEDILQGGDRAWVDYSNAAASGLVWFDSSMVRSGCGADELGDYMKKDVSAMITMPVCIPAVMGANTSVRNDVTHRNPVLIPLFESTGCTLPSGTSDCPGNTYLVNGVGCAEVFTVPTKVDICYKGDTDCHPSRSEWLIRIRIACDSIGDKCSAQIGGTSGGVPGPNDLKAVSLIE